MYNQYDNGLDLNFETDPEERKRRLAMLSGLSGGQSFGDVAGQQFDNRVNQVENRVDQVGQMVENPEEAFRKRVLGQTQQPQPMQPQTVAGPQVPTMPDETSAETQRLLQQNQIAQGVPTQPTPMAPVAPETVQQPTEQQTATGAPTGPAVPTVEREQPTETVPGQEAVNEVNQTVLPKAGPPVQVASAPGAVNPATQPAVTPGSVPTVERETEQLTPEQQQQQKIIDAHNEKNPQVRIEKFASILSDPKADPGAKALANKLIAEDYIHNTKTAKAEEKANTAGPLDIQRYMKDKSEEGSYVKAILFSRLGLTALAQQEQEKISPTRMMGSEIGEDGQRYSVVRNKEGFITTAFDSKGKEATPEMLASLSASAMATKGNIGHAGATRVRDSSGKEWSVVPTTRGSQFYDNSGKPGVPEGKTVPITVGGDVELQNTLGLNRTRIKLEGVKAEDRVRTLEDVNKKRMAEGLPALSTSDIGIDETGRFTTGGGIAPAAQAAQAGATTFKDPSIKIISGQRPTSQQQAMYDESVRAGRPGVTAQGNPIAMPGTSAHEGAQGNAYDIDAKALTKSGRAELAAQGYYQPIPQQDPNHWERLPGAQGAATPSGVSPTTNFSVAELQRQREIAKKQAEENIQVSGKRSESFNKILDEEVRPQAQAGDTVSSVRKQQFAIFDRPGVDSNKLFGLYNAAQENPGDQKLSILRDVFGGVFKPETEVSQRLAQLNLTPQEKSALQEYNIANQRINAATLKQTAGPGSVSDAEQRANRESNVDPTKIPALGAYNSMAQSQFSGDLARYKGDWADKQPASNALQLDKAWRKETQQLTNMYADIAKQRADFISKNGATTNAVKEGYKRYPIPEYDPQTESWKKTKPLAEIFGK